MLIMMISDTILLAIVFYMTLFLPQPRIDDFKLKNSARPLIWIEKIAIDNYLLNNTLDSLDLTKKYSILYDKTTGKFLIKKGCWKIEINPLWIYMWWSQTFGKKYCIEIKKLHPLEFQTTFTQGGLVIKYK